MWPCSKCAVALKAWPAPGCRNTESGATVTEVTVTGVVVSAMTTTAVSACPDPLPMTRKVPPVGPAV